MVMIESASSLSSSSTSSRKKEKRNPCSENDNREAIKGKSVKRASSSSSLNKEKHIQNDSHERIKSKLIQKASSFSSLKKERQIQSGGHERIKSKLIQKANSFSSLPSPLRKEKLVRQGTSLSSSNVESPKRVRKEKQPEARKSSSLKSKIKESGPICKKRKEVLSSFDMDNDFEVYFNKEINEGTMINPDDCFWLSSGKMSPHELAMFVSGLDPCLDEWVISFLPESTAHISEVQEPMKQIVGPVEAKACTVEDPSASSSSSSSLALSTHTNNSAFWNMDRTGVWVSLINLECEDSKLISNSISDDDDMDSNFPSPTYETTWDSYSSDNNLGVSSSARSTQESSHSDWSSDLLSDSLDWDLDSDDPIFWPFGMDSGSGWDPNSESFSVSPRKGTYKTGNDSENDGSIKFRLHGRREGSKDGVKRKILFVSGLSASKIIEFKKGYRNKFGSSSRTSKKGSQIGKRGGRFNKRVPPILETDLEGISPKETPTKQAEDLVDNLDMLSGTEDWGDEMDSDGPLVWPNDQNSDWNVTCDFLNISPRKNVVTATNFGSPKGGFTVSSSVRLKFQPTKKTKTKPGYGLSSLGASRSLKFKPASHKRVAATPLRLSPSCKSWVLIVPPKRASLFNFKPTGSNHGITRINTGQGKRIRANMPLKVGRSVQEFLRMVSVASTNKKFLGDYLTSEEIPIETVMGLNEFDGHEGVDVDFEEGRFSFEECMKD